MLELQHVEKTFSNGHTAVADVSLQLQPGVVGLIGHNGAGKTTLMQMIATLTRPSRGQIRFQGHDITQTPDVIRRRLGFLPQDFGVYPRITALEFMRYMAALKGVNNEGRIHQLLEMVNLHGQAQREAAAFSGGMKRRLGIAQALLNDPDVLVVDEPTSGLDPQERLRFRNLLADLGRHKLVLLSTHIVSDVESIADQLAILRAGQLVAFERPDDLIAQAYGQVWQADVAPEQVAALGARVQVLNAQRQGAVVRLRMHHPYPPCPGAQAVQASLEDALMAPRFALQGAPLADQVAA